MSVLACCWPQSVVAGDPVGVHRGGDAVANVRIEVVRDGLTPASYWQSDDVVVEPRAMPDDAPEEGCTDWAYGLGDPRIDRITRNVIERATRTSRS